jgi:hypothetical protein
MRLAKPPAVTFAFRERGGRVGPKQTFALDLRV